MMIAACSVRPAAQGELIERTLALVGGEAITLSDVRGALALGLVDVPAAADQIPAATKRLIDRALMLREVQRYAPAEPALARRRRSGSRRCANGLPQRMPFALHSRPPASPRHWCAHGFATICASRRTSQQRFAAAESAERRAELDHRLDFRPETQNAGRRTRQRLSVRRRPP